MQDVNFSLIVVSACLSFVKLKLNKCLKKLSLTKLNKSQSSFNLKLKQSLAYTKLGVNAQLTLINLKPKLSKN